MAICGSPSKAPSRIISTACGRISTTAGRDGLVMTEGSNLLAALQHGDSFFPGGATAFSWGLETLAGEGRVATAADVRDYVRTQLRGRWATFDRAAMIAAYRAAGDLEKVAAIDRMVEAQPDQVRLHPPGTG